MKNIGNIKQTTDYLEKYGFNIKKKYGQNFLIEQSILNKIVDSADLSKSFNVIEIGPGLGSLTEKLIDKANKVIAYEIDEELVPILNDNFDDKDNFSLINDDFLKRDVNIDINQYFDDNNDVVVVANLPYYITTAILTKIIETIPKVKRIIVMMQYEVGVRICSKPNTKDYNALSVAIQYKCDAKLLFKVPRNVFIPKPNVDSAIISLNIKNTLEKVPQNEDFFYKFIKNCFSQRRKTLKNNISNHYPISKNEIDRLFKEINILANVRAENLSVSKLIDLSDLVLKIID